MQTRPDESVKICEIRVKNLFDNAVKCANLSVS